MELDKKLNFLHGKSIDSRIIGFFSSWDFKNKGRIKLYKRISKICSAHVQNLESFEKANTYYLSSATKYCNVMSFKLIPIVIIQALSSGFSQFINFSSGNFNHNLFF